MVKKMVSEILWIFVWKDQSVDFLIISLPYLHNFTDLLTENIIYFHVYNTDDFFSYTESLKNFQKISDFFWQDSNIYFNDLESIWSLQQNRDIKV